MYKYKQVCKDGKRMLVHRKVMEEHLGRKLKTEEVVHHIDGNQTNNVLENLELMSDSQHSKFHAKKPQMIELICSNCGIVFYRRKKRYEYDLKGGKNIFTCSRKCTGKICEKYFPHEGGIFKYRDIIEKGLSEGLEGFEISKKYGINKKTVWYYIKKKKDGKIK